MIQRMFVTLDTKKTNYKNVGKINHGDDLILELTVLSDGDMISLNDPMVDLLVKKSDGKMIRQNSGIEHIKPNKFIIEVNKDCVTSPGLSTNQLIINDNGRISTCMFYYTILNSLEEDIIESISNVEVLEQLDEFTIQIKDKMENFDEELQNRMSELEDAIDDLVEFFGDTSVDLLEAELSRNEAEQSRAQAESVRVQNENRRLQNDLDLANAEAERVRAENIRIQNEVDRALVDAVMDQKESEREDSELERIQNESKRATDEELRQQNESVRQSNESVRISNENDRKTQENRRVTAETNRVNAETTRRNNENSRISNEIERQKAMNEMKSLIGNVNDFDGRVSVIEDEIEEINSSLDNIKNKIQVSVSDFGAIGNANYYNSSDDKYYVDSNFTILANDDTECIQKALNIENVSIRLPKGNYWVSKPLVIKGKELDFFGDGISTSKIVFTGDIHCFTTTSTLLRVLFRDFTILGTMDRSGSCFRFEKSCTLNRSEFRNLILYSGDTCLHCRYDYSCIYENIHVWSRNGNGFEIEGRNSTTLINCYAHQIENKEKCGYRIYNYATLIGCNGVDLGSTWGIFGGISTEDGINYSPYVTMIGCNLEDFSEKALVIKNQGKVSIIGCKFDSNPNNTYEHFIYAPNANVEFTLIGNKDISTQKASISHILAKYDYGNVFVSGSDIKTVTNSIYNLTTIYDKSNGKTSYVLPSTGILNRVGRIAVIEEGSSSIGRIVDNIKEIGDELKIIVNCEDINLKNATMGTNSDQSIITKENANRALTKGEIVKLAFNGTNWIEI